MQQQDFAVGGCYRGHKDKWAQTGNGLIPEGETPVSDSNSLSVPRMELHKFVQRIICKECVVARDLSGWCRMPFQVLNPKCMDHCRGK